MTPIRRAVRIALAESFVLESCPMETQPELAEIRLPSSPTGAPWRELVSAAWAQRAASAPDLPQDADPWIERGAAILAHNLAGGRFKLAQHYQPGGLDGQAALLSYAGQILQELVAEADLLARLQRGDSPTWAAVIDRLERTGYAWLGPIGREDWAAWEAREAAAATCADLWLWLQEHPYPFDVPFARWSARALMNRLREAAARRALTERIFVESLDRPVYPTPDSPTVGELLGMDTLAQWLEQTANREALLQVLTVLDARQERIVRLWYFHGIPADEIAAELGLSLGNVYILRFRAIEKLRKAVLSDERFGLADALPVLEAEKRRSRLALNGQAAQGGSTP